MSPAFPTLLWMFQGWHTGLLREYTCTTRVLRRSDSLSRSHVPTWCLTLTS
jgi:hypothetical protein